MKYDPLADTAEYPTPGGQTVPAMRYTAQAAKLLADRAAADGLKGLDPNLIIQAILALITQLGLCKPTPAAGYAYLAWKPVARWWDFLPWAKSVEDRLYEYREGIVTLIRRDWKAIYGDFRSFVVTLWSAVDAGDVNENIMAGLYQDARP